MHRLLVFVSLAIVQLATGELVQPLPPGKPPITEGDEPEVQSPIRSALGIPMPQTPSNPSEAQAQPKKDALVRYKEYRESLGVPSPLGTVGTESISSLPTDNNDSRMQPKNTRSGGRKARCFWPFWSYYDYDYYEPYPPPPPYYPPGPQYPYHGGW